MKPITAVFFGRAGSGKGTQAKLLMEYLKSKDANARFIYVETGERLRAFMKGGSYSAKVVKETLDAGKLLGAFLPIWIWTSQLVEEYKGGEHIIFDGVARRLEEAPILDSAMPVYSSGDKPFVIHLDVPPPEVKVRLLKRGRHDDVEEKIAERLRAYDTDIIKSVNYFKSSENVRFVNIDGDQPVGKVHEDVLKALGI